MSDLPYQRDAVWVSTHLLLQQQGTACHAACAVARSVMCPGVCRRMRSWQVQMLIAVHGSCRSGLCHFIFWLELVEGCGMPCYQSCGLCQEVSWCGLAEARLAGSDSC